MNLISFVVMKRRVIVETNMRRGLCLVSCVSPGLFVTYEVLR